MGRNAFLFGFVLCLLLAGRPWAAESTGPADSAVPADLQRQERIARRDRLWQQARELQAPGKQAEAIAVGEKILELEEQIFGPVHEELTGTLEWLAGQYLLARRFGDARSAAERSQQVCERVYGADAWQTVTARWMTDGMARLAGAEPAFVRQAISLNAEHIRLYRAGKYRAAVEKKRELAAVEGQIYGESHPARANTFWTIADMLVRLRDFAAAERAALMCLEIRLATLRATHPETASALFLLARSHYYQQQYEDAARGFGLAAEVYELVEYPEHSAWMHSWRGDALRDGGEDAEAIVAYRECMARFEALGEREGLSVSVPNLAMVLLRQGQIAAAAEALWQLPLADTERTARRAERKRLQTLRQQAMADGALDEAVEAARALLLIELHLFGEEHEQVMASLQSLALAHQQLEDFVHAIQLRGEILRIARQLFGDRSPQVTDARVALAYTRRLSQLSSADRQRLAAAGQQNEQIVRLDLAGRSREALDAANEALLVRTELLGPENPYTTISLNNLAMLYVSLGDYAKAKPLFVRSLEIREKVLGPEHPATATALNGLAELYHLQGDLAAAERLFIRTLEVLEKTRGAEHRFTAVSLNNLAMLYQTTGDFARAEPLLGRSLEISEKVAGAEHPFTATAAGNLAVLYESMGDYAKAEPLHVRALEIREKALGPQHPDTATGLNNLAALYYAQRDYAKAEPLFVRSLQVTEKSRGPEHPDTAISLDNLAALYESLGDYAQAEPLRIRSLETFEKALGAKHPSTSNSLNNLGALYQAMDDHAKAEPLFVRSLEIREKTLGAEHPSTAASLHNLAFLYRSMGDDARAEPLCGRALGILFKNLELAAAIQSERQQLAMLADNRGTLDNYLAICLRSGQYTESGYSQVLAWKGSVFARQLGVQAVADRPELLPLFEKRQQVTRHLAQLAFAVDSHDPVKWQQAIATLSAQRELLDRELSAASAAYRSARQAVTAEDIRASLPGNARLVDFLEVWRSGRQHLLAFVLSAETPTVLLDLGDATELARAIALWRVDWGRSSVLEAGNLLADRLPDSSPQRTAIQDFLSQACEAVRNQSTGQLLRQRIWEPLRPHLGDAKLVLIAPDGALGRFPFAALPGRSPDTYLVEDVSIAVIPTPQLLPESLAAGRPQRKVAGNLLVVGGVDYNRRSILPGQTEAVASISRAAPRGDREAPFLYLPHSREELTFVEERYREIMGSAGITSLSGSDATEEAIRRLASEHRYVHLATHGFFASERLRSALDRPVAGPETLGREWTTQQTVFGYHPGLLSGVALAGANQPVPDADDGILTAEEVSGLDLRAVELVVLSACETGLGLTAGGEGLLGLQRAFQAAGASATIASLWEVDDAAARAFMSEFYTNLWQEGQSKLDAFHNAQLTMLRDYDPRTRRVVRRGLRLLDADQPAPSLNSPYYWAAFVLSGDWR